MSGEAVQLVSADEKSSEIELFPVTACDVQTSVYFNVPDPLGQGLGKPSGNTLHSRAHR